jgi:predicted RNA-binding protein YlxR (DUF448 family)
VADKETYTQKQYPEESRKRLEVLLEETKGARKVLDELDTNMATIPSPTEEVLKEWARKAIGHGNYLRKKHARLESAAKNEKLARKMEIKIEFIQNNPGKTFYDNAADTEASSYIAPLRVVRDILNSYVVSADNLVSVIRIQLYKQQEGNKLEI